MFLEISHVSSLSNSTNIFLLKLGNRLKVVSKSLRRLRCDNVDATLAKRRNSLRGCNPNMKKNIQIDRKIGTQTFTKQFRVK